jgi:protein-S-isoprenylcysteine O-methyltransferase Ste14
MLVRSGPYRFIRHPGYLGLILPATLPGLIVGSIAGFAGLLLTTLVHTLLRIRAEEQMLEREFGGSCREYARSTKRLAPFVY